MFGSPKAPPPPPPPPNPAASPIPVQQDKPASGLAPAAASLISTSVAGLKRRADTQRTSLIGGA